MNIITTALLALTLLSGCGASKVNEAVKPSQTTNLEDYSTAYFASGCFWCVEAIYESVEGVPEVISGYAAGTTDNPTYRQVGSGRTGHAEVVEVYYDPEVVSYKTLVDVFYASQDATTIGQAPDFGSAYRSIIFYKNDEEKTIAEAAKADQAQYYDKPVVTEILEHTKFWVAEDYHQDYERLHPNASYIVGVSIPRLKRFQAKMPAVLKAKH